MRKLLVGVFLSACLAAAGCGDDSDNGGGEGGTGGSAGAGGDGGSGAEGGSGGTGGVIPKDCDNLPDTTAYSVPNAPATSSDDCDVTLDATGTEDQVQIITAITEAQTGDVICLNPGMYDVAATLDITATPELTLKGIGGSPDDVVLDFKERGSKGIFVSVDDVTIENMWVKNTAENAVEQRGTTGSVFRKLHVSWDAGSITENGAYCIYPTDCFDTVIEFNQVSGASDAGLYVGKCEGGTVNNNWVHANVAGVEVENSLDVDVFDNEIFDNTGGLLALQEPIPGGRLTNTNVFMFDNEVFCNNRSNFALPGSTVAELPQGTGAMSFGGAGVEIFDNVIDGNVSVGMIIVSNVLLCQLSGQDCDFDEIPGYNPYPEQIYIHDNTYVANGEDPQSILADISIVTGVPMPTIIWDGYVRPGVTDPQICLGTEELPTYYDLTQNMCQDAESVEACIIMNASPDATGRSCAVDLPIEDPEPI
ncbi:MAG: parallel beta-helix domain-containing protein [Myxococcota bacterium]